MYRYEILCAPALKYDIKTDGEEHDSVTGWHVFMCDMSKPLDVDLAGFVPSFVS